MDCEELPLKTRQEQAESLWVKIKDKIKTGHLVVEAYYGLPDQKEPAEETFCFGYKSHCTPKLSSQWGISIAWTSAEKTIQLAASDPGDSWRTTSWPRY